MSEYHGAFIIFNAGLSRKLGDFGSVINTGLCAYLCIHCLKWNRSSKSTDVRLCVFNVIFVYLNAYIVLSCFRCYLTMTSQWARLRLKSPASRLFTQTFIQMQIKETIRDRWIHRTKEPVTRKMFPFDDVIMTYMGCSCPQYFNICI